MMGFFERLKDGLQKTRKNFTERIEVLVGMSAEIDDDFLDELEMILLSADVGAKTTEKLIEAVRQAARKKEILSVKLDEEVVDPDDIEMLEDLIVAATNEALRKVEDENAAMMQQLTGGLGGLF